MSKQAKKLPKELVDSMINLFLDTIQLTESRIRDPNANPEEIALADRVNQQARDALSQLTNSPDSGINLENIAPIAREAMLVLGRLIINDMY